MPKRKVEPTKFRIMFRGGVCDSKIEEMMVSELPEVLYAPHPPADFAIDPSDACWRTAVYNLSSDPADFDIQAFYDFGKLV